MKLGDLGALFFIPHKMNISKHRPIKVVICLILFILLFSLCWGWYYQSLVEFVLVSVTITGVMFAVFLLCLLTATFLFGCYHLRRFLNAKADTLKPISKGLKLLTSVWIDTLTFFTLCLYVWLLAVNVPEGLNTLAPSWREFRRITEDFFDEYPNHKSAVDQILEEFGPQTPK